MMLTATLVNYYFTCRRKLWLHAHEIRMEHTSDVVYEGKLLHEKAYPQRAERYREIELDGVKIDFYDPHNQVVHEIKKSDSVETAHIAQVKFYLWKLRENGIEGATGVIEYPKIRQTTDVCLTDEDTETILGWMSDIDRITAGSCPPDLRPKSFCRKCSYFDFCWIDE